MSQSNKRKSKETFITNPVQVGMRSDNSKVYFVGFRGQAPLCCIVEEGDDIDYELAELVPVLEKYLGDEIDIDYDLLENNKKFNRGDN
jgi:hypothetical protein